MGTFIDEPPRLLGPRDMADRLDCASETLTRLVRDGRLPCYRFGDRPTQWRFDPAEVLRLLRGGLKHEGGGT